MNDRSSLFAGLGDILTEMCCFYMVAGLLIMNSETWGVSLGALFLPVPISLLLFALLLKKPRSVPLLTVITIALMAVSVTGWCLFSVTPLRVGYLFLLLVGSGIAVGRSLNVALHRVDLHNHLVHMDVLLIVLFALLLIRSSELINIPTGAVLLALFTLPVEIASAIGLRMTEDGNADLRGAVKASLISLLAFALVLLIILGLSALLSDSGEVTGSLLHDVGEFFRSIGDALERFFRWFANLVAAEDKYEAVPLEEMASIADLERESAQNKKNLNATPLYIGIAVLLAAGLALVAVLLRKAKLQGAAPVSAASAEAELQRDTNFLARLWQRWMENLHFRWECFRKRNTPEGIFLTLERRGKRKKRPRLEGETMRQYIERLDTRQALAALADALDAGCYSPHPVQLSLRDRGKLRRAARRVYH